jgi:hypothetical protein
MSASCLVPARRVFVGDYKDSSLLEVDPLLALIMLEYLASHPVPV